MPDRVFVDTSFVIALINDRDQYYEQAKAVSHKFETAFLITTDAVLLEIGNALAKDYRAEAIEIIKVLRHSKKVEVRAIDETLLEKGLEIYEMYKDKTWGLVDCISFVVMRDEEVNEVLTFDNDFIQAGFNVVGI